MKLLSAPKKRGKPVRVEFDEKAVRTFWDPTVRTFVSRVEADGREYHLVLSVPEVLGILSNLPVATLAKALNSEPRRDSSPGRTPETVCALADLADYFMSDRCLEDER
jgi:hypothetical protein